MTRIDRIVTRPSGAYGPGHAVIEVVGQDLPAAEGCAMVLRQGSGAALKTLGPHGWQSSEVRLIPLAARTTADGLELVVGPEVVQHLRPGNYTLVLGEAATKAFSWTLAPFRPSRTAVVAEPDPVPAARPLPTSDSTLASAPSAPAPSPQPVSTPEPAPSPEPTPTPELEPEPEPVPPPLTAGPSPQPVTPPAPAWHRLALWGGLAAGVAAVAAVALFLLLPFDDGETSPPPAHAAAPVSGAIDDAARRMVAENASPDSLGALGRQLLAEGQVGSALLLLRRAGDGGDVDSLLALGRLFDPSVPDPRAAGAPAPNGVMAATLYHRAGTLRVGAGQSEMAALIAWAESRAETGDATARAILFAVPTLDN